MSVVGVKLASIYKALFAGGGALLTGLIGALRADQWNLHALTSDQVSPILALALGTGVAVFAKANGAGTKAPVAAVVTAAPYGRSLNTAPAPAPAVDPLAGLADTLTAALAPHLDAIQSAFDAAAATGDPVPAATPATPAI